jgi:hypothetical protein
MVGVGGARCSASAEASKRFCRCQSRCQVSVPNRILHACDAHSFPVSAECSRLTPSPGRRADPPRDCHLGRRPAGPQHPVAVPHARRLGASRAAAGTRAERAAIFEGARNVGPCRWQACGPGPCKQAAAKRLSSAVHAHRLPHASVQPGMQPTRRLHAHHACPHLVPLCPTHCSNTPCGRRLPRSCNAHPQRIPTTTLACLAQTITVPAILANLAKHGERSRDALLACSYRQWPGLSIAWLVRAELAQTLLSWLVVGCRR